MWVEESKNGKFKFCERYEDYLTGKTKRVSVTMDKNTSQSRKTAQKTLELKIQQAMGAPKSGKTREAFTYALNQERYLRIFLEDGDVPIDNNASERAIRGFCIGKKNWEMIDTVNGATSSAIIYSIAETAKANNLKPFDYFEYLLTEIQKHTGDKNTDFLAELLPWSKTLPEHIRKPKKAEEK